MYEVCPQRVILQSIWSYVMLFTTELLVVFMLFTTEILVVFMLLTTELRVVFILFITELLVVFILFTTELLVVVVVSWDVFCLGHTHGYLLVTLTDEHLTGVVGTCMVKERRGMERGREGER